MIRQWFIPVGALLAFSTFASAKYAPDLKFSDSEGTEYSLADLRGKTVVLEWMDPYCEANGRLYNDKSQPQLQQEYAGDDLVWLMISPYGEDSENYVSPNVARYLFMSTNAKVHGFVPDPTRVLTQAFGVDYLPHAVVLSSAGEVVYSGALGFDGHEDQRDLSKTLEQLEDGGSLAEDVLPPGGCKILEQPNP